VLSRQLKSALRGGFVHRVQPFIGSGIAHFRGPTEGPTWMVQVNSLSTSGNIWSTLGKVRSTLGNIQSALGFVHVGSGIAHFCGPTEGPTWMVQVKQTKAKNN
jgi:hypothetical protein